MIRGKLVFGASMFILSGSLCFGQAAKEHDHPMPALR